MKARSILFWASVLGFLGVALGAFGAHALHDRLGETGRVATWETAVLYHLVHAVALLAIGLWKREAPGSRLLGWAGRFFFAGIVIFGGSLYILCLSGINWLGAITPIGGVAFLAGWVCLALASLRERE